jgi:hypothetical protein
MGTLKKQNHYSLVYQFFWALQNGFTQPFQKSKKKDLYHFGSVSGG